MYDLLIKNGEVVYHDKISKVNIAINGEKIVALLDVSIKVEAKKIIDAAGQYVFPGIIDCHAHINDPGFTWREDFKHATAAAAVGGTTTIIDMPTCNQPATTSALGVQAKIESAKGKALIDFGLWGGITPENHDKLEEQHDAGVLAFKAFMIRTGDKDFPGVELGHIKRAMEIYKELNAFAGFHCEDDSITFELTNQFISEGKNTVRDYLDSRPVVAELIATRNIIDLVRYTNAKAYICHVSHPDVAKIIKEAQDEGLPIQAETCAHYLIKTEDDVIAKGNEFKCSPVIRDKKAQDGLWQYLLNGTLINIGSDNSPSTFDEKDPNKLSIWKSWGGLNASFQFLLQFMFNATVHERKLSPTWISKWLSYNPANSFGIYGKKGDIEIGFDADITILDPNKEWTITKDELQTLNKVSPFIGDSGKGAPVCTIVRGEVVAENGKPCDEKFGFGQVVKRVN